MNNIGDGGENVLQVYIQFLYCEEDGVLIKRLAPWCPPLKSALKAAMVPLDEGRLVGDLGANGLFGGHIKSFPILTFGTESGYKLKINELKINK